MTTLKELKALGGVIADAPVEKSITFKIDEQEYAAKIYIKRLSIGDHEKLIGHIQGEERTAHLISTAVMLGDGGKERISFKDAYQLHPSLAEAMLGAFNEVNGPKKP